MVDLEELRLKCLYLAAERAREFATPEDIVSAAREFESFVRMGAPMCTPATRPFPVVGQAGE